MAPSIQALYRLATGRARRLNTIVDDTSWEEVEKINSYAVFLGYLSMAVRGLGLLVLTWTTVVLLGGFVSVLGKKDFWCLTGITFTQAAGVFDSSSSKKLSNIGVMFFGMRMTVINVAIFITWDIDTWFLEVVVNLITAAVVFVQALVYVLILFPIIALYISGPYIPIWLAVWRLTHRDDYRNRNKDDRSGANLEVALDVLYALVLAQGVLAYYMTMYRLAGRRLAKEVAEHCLLGNLARECAGDYLADTKKGCSEDPSFARDERNLITYAATLIRSESPEDNLHGAVILEAFIQRIQEVRRDGRYVQHWNEMMGRHTLLQQIMVASGGGHQPMHKLLRMLDSRGPYDRGTRRRAARVVAHLAGDVHLEQFPGAIHWVASLLEEYTVLEPYQRGWLRHMYQQQDLSLQSLPVKKPGNIKQLLDDDDYATRPLDGYRDMVVQGLTIIGRLAEDDEHNCMIIGSTQGLLSGIMAPLTQDLVHSQDHDESWTTIVEASLRAMCQIAAAPGETGKKLRLKICSSREAIFAMEEIIKCETCVPSLREKAINTLMRLYMDKSAGMIVLNSGRENFVKMLLDVSFGDEAGCPTTTVVTYPEYLENKHRERMIMLLGMASERAQGSMKCMLQVTRTQADKKRDIRETAAGALVRLSLEMEDIASLILKANDRIVNHLTRFLLNVESKTYERVAAALILERICFHHRNDDEDLKNLKKDMIDAMPKILREMLSSEPAEETQKRTETDEVSSERKDDIESQHRESEDNNVRRSSSHKWEEKKTKYLSESQRLHADNLMGRFIAASLSLYVTVLDTSTSADQDLANHFDAVTLVGDAAVSVTKLLQDLVERNSHPTGYCLTVVKLISKMVISMLKHGGCKVEELDGLMESLSIALRNLSDVDASMVFATSDEVASIALDRLVNPLMEKPIKISLRCLVNEAQKLVDEKKAAQVQDME